jgi:hypothetical protein
LTSWEGEVSARAFLLHFDRFELYALAGPGVHREELPGITNDVTTVHAGIGGEVGLTPRIYLRPEIRTRWPSDHLDDRFRSTDYTLGFGWRL